MSLEDDLVKLREQWIAKLCAELVEAVGGHSALGSVGIAPEMGEALLTRALVVGRIAALVANGSSPVDIVTLLAAGDVFIGSGSRPEQLTDLVDKVHCRVGFDGITGSVGFLGYGLRAWSPESTYLLLLELWAARRLGVAPAARVKRELTGIWGVRDPDWLDACLSRPVDPLQGYPDLWVTLKAESDVRVANVAAVAFSGNPTSKKAWQQWADRLPLSLSQAEHVLKVGGDLVCATRARRLLRRQHDEVDADLRSVMARALVIIEDQLERVVRAVAGLSTLERELLRERTAEEHFQDRCLAELADRSHTMSATASWYDGPSTTHGMWGPLPWWTMTVRGRDQEQAAAATLAEGTLPLGFHRDPAETNRLELICRRPRTGAPGLRAHFMFDLTNPADAGELLMIGRRGGVCIDVHSAIDDEDDDQTVIQLGTLSVAAGPELACMLTDIASKALKELLPVDRDQDACEPGIPALGEALQQVSRCLLRSWSPARELLVTEPACAGSEIMLETVDPPTTMDRFAAAEKRRAGRSSQCATPRPLRALYKNGFVYVQRNPAFGDMLKIGYTQRLPEDRADQLSCTPVPFAYEVLSRVVTSRAHDVEQAVHRLLAAQRVAPNREFFRVSQEMAEDAIRYCQELVTGVGSWDPLPKVHQLRAGDRVTLPLKAGQVFVTTAYPHWLAPSAEIMDIWQAHADGDVLELHLTNNPEPVRGMSDNDPGADEDPVPFLSRDNSAHNGSLIGQERLTAGDRLVWLSDQDNPNILSNSVVFEMQDFCQVICRTWKPQRGSHGLPLTLNDVTRTASPAIAEQVQAVFQLDAPRTWTQRDAGWEYSEARGTRPEDWLPQLRQRRRRR